MTLEKLRKYCRDNQSNKPQLVVAVCYPMDYAAEVHERTDQRHKVGQAKYLETAAKHSEQEVKQRLREASKQGPKHLAEEMLRCGLLIQRNSQQLCPVDTSALRSSAFTSVEEELDSKSTQKRSEAEALRLTKLAQREQRKRSKKK